MGLDRWHALHHLLRLGLLRPEEIVAEDITATATLSRNRLVRVERQGRPGFVVKQPRDTAQPDAATMWTEAALFWLAANDTGFAPLRPWMPRYHHYDPLQRMLTIEFVAPAQSLAEKLFGAGVPPGVAAQAGQVFAILHGPVSAAALNGPSRSLFASTIPWVLTLGFADNRYVPSTPVSAATLRDILARPEVMAGLAALRGSWRAERIVHGDAKAANLLILADGGVRLIDWEIAGLGDPLWDVAGLIHSILIPNPAAAPETLAQAQGRARPLVEAIWRAYAGFGPIAGAAGDAPARLLAMAGARILQTSLEATHYGAPMPGMPAMLAMAAELLASPQQARERWQWT